MLERIFCLFQCSRNRGWPLTKRVQNWIVDPSTAHDFTVCGFELGLIIFEFTWWFYRNCTGILQGFYRDLMIILQLLQRWNIIFLICLLWKFWTISIFEILYFLKMCPIFVLSALFIILVGLRWYSEIMMIFNRCMWFHAQVEQKILNNPYSKYCGIFTIS